jgi:hypothetical protein
VGNGSLRPQRSLRLCGTAVFLIVLAAGLARSSVASHPTLHVIARNLNNPRKIFVGAHGTLYVVEGGVGGRALCLGAGSSKTCVGLTGSITRVEHGVQKRVVTGLVSFAPVSGRGAEGPAAVVVRGRSYYVVLQDTTIGPNGSNSFGPAATTAGELISTPPGRARPTEHFNFAAFEAARNPDRGAGPGARFGDPPIDSDPYAFVPFRGGFAAVDAAGNDLLWIRPNGSVSVLAVFPTQKEPLTPTLRKTIGAPKTMSSIKAQSVPTSVVVGPDGALYVGELTGVPFEPGAARVWRVAPGHKPSVYANGLTNISDIAFDGRDLLVLEIAARGLLDASSGGVLIKIAPNGKQTILASAGLHSPTGLAVQDRVIYISNYGTSRGSGRGPHGELVALTP